MGGHAAFYTEGLSSITSIYFLFNLNTWIPSSPNAT